jgi:cold shock CspA family protein
MSCERLIGRVKWFNSKSGFGFITVCSDGSHSGKDIFAHYSSLRGESAQYKYLVQGEYVEFNLVKSPSEQHEFNSVDVSGIKGGLLMCDTHRLNSTSNGREPMAPRTPSSVKKR